MNNLSFADARLTKGGRPQGGVRGRRRSRWSAFLALLVVQGAVLSGLAAAQGTSTPSEGVDNGNYNYQGSFEFGYRFVDTNGSQPVYNTFVDEQQGLRLFEQTLSVRSLNHEGNAAPLSPESGTGMHYQSRSKALQTSLFHWNPSRTCSFLSTNVFLRSED